MRRMPRQTLMSSSVALISVTKTSANLKLKMERTANPMVTTLSMSHMIATQLAQRLKQEDSSAGKPTTDPTLR